MQSYLMHDFIHDKSGTGHIARVFHKGYKEKQNEDVGQEDNNASHSSNDPIDKQVFKRSLVHDLSHPVAQQSHACFDPFHGVLTQRESGLKHQPHKQKKQRKTDEFMGHEIVNRICSSPSLYGVFLEGLLECTRNKTIAG